MSHFSKKLFALFLVGFGLLAAGTVFAAGGADVGTRLYVFGVTDTEAPSIPLNLLALPLSTSSIYLSWSSSTDNVGVAGYQVFRDGSFIATSSWANYTDNGLLASTTYQYYVTAFDWSANISSSSASVSTTTLPIAAPTTTPTSTREVVEPSVGSLDRFLKFLSIEFTPFVADKQGHLEIKIMVNQPAGMRVRYGETPDFELGSAISARRDLRHDLAVDGLVPGKRYYLEIVATGPNGLMAKEERVVRIPVTSYLNVLPEVGEFDYQLSGDQIILSWLLPVLAAGGEVRLVRSPYFYPLRPDGGWVIYRGQAGDTIDTYRGTQYYTIFVCDNDNRCSAGRSLLVPARVKARTADQIVKKSYFTPRNFIVSEGDYLVLELDQRAAGDNAKAVLVELAGPNNSIADYLLTNEEQKDVYHSSRFIISSAGKYNYQIIVYDLFGARRVVGGGEIKVLSADRLAADRSIWGWLLLFIFSAGVLALHLWRNKD